MKNGRTGNKDKDFDLEAFLPYLLNQAAEATGRAFQEVYKAGYGMTRAQWRVIANLGKFGAMTASDICQISHIEKTKVSRAVAALEAQGYIRRAPSRDDRRAEILSLTGAGGEVFRQLGLKAADYDRKLRCALGEEPSATLEALLRRLADLGAEDKPDES